MQDLRQASIEDGPSHIQRYVALPPCVLHEAHHEIMKVAHHEIMTVTHHGMGKINATQFSFSPKATLARLHDCNHSPPFVSLQITEHRYYLREA
jgi:hypothetical protein